MKGIIYNMEYKNDNRTPCERIDEEMLRRLLEEDGYTPTGISVNKSMGSRANNNLASSKCSCHSGHENSVCSCRNNCSSVKDRNCDNSVSGKSLAMVYSQMQTWQEIYNIDDGFPAGTIFKELDFPWYASNCMKEGRCCE